MKRKTSNFPSRIYTYGCRAPTIGADLVEREFAKARKYKNTLIEIERDRRAEITKAQEANDTIAPLVAEVVRLDAAIEAEQVAIKAVRAKTRSRTTGPTARGRIAALKAERKTVREKMKAAKAAALETLKPIYDAINEHAQSRAKVARGGEEVPYWGTYILVEKAMEAARKSKTPPQFRRWDGSGRIGVQFQRATTTPERREEILGAPVADLFAGIDRRMQLVSGSYEMKPVVVRAGKNAGKTLMVQDKWGKVRIRIGSVGKEPLWAEFPVIFHREMPADAVAKAAWIRRRRCGTKYLFDLQIAIESRTFIAPARTGNREVAIDVGWRKGESDTRLRVAFLRDSDGMRREVVLPAKFKVEYEKTFALRAQQDRNFDAVRENLVLWLRENASIVPEWLTEDTNSLSQWRSCARLAKVVTSWRDRRFEGDAFIFPALEAWRRQNKHLYEWASNLRDRVLGARKSFYQNFAAELTSKYDRIYIEDFDLREVTKLLPPESSKMDAWAPARRQRFEVAISEFRGCLESAASLSGTAIIKRDPSFTTRMCEICKAIESFDAARELVHTCSKCGATWDQDDNASGNILSGERPDERVSAIA